MGGKDGSRLMIAWAVKLSMYAQESSSREGALITLMIVEM